MSFAAFRQEKQDELLKLAEEHIEKDLTPCDRKILKSAANKVSTQATIGSLLGLGLGLAAAWKIRSNRVKFFEAFKATQKPTHVKFADGREEAIPDITPLLEPSRWGDIATYTFFSIAGVFLGGETGMLTGMWSGSKTVTKDPDVKVRVERAYRNYRADILRKELKALESDKPHPRIDIWSHRS